MSRQWAQARQAVRCAAIVALLLPVAACGTRTLSAVKADGTADQVVWPSADDALWRPVKPQADHLQGLQRGMDKDVLRERFGVPHFREGHFGVREWDYVFDLSEANGPPRCAFKILFDTDMRAQRFYWQDRACADWAAGRARTQAAASAEPASPPLLPFASLSTDVLFAFDSATLNAQGVSALAPLVDDLRKQAMSTPEGHRLSIRVAGHSDRLGEQAHNAELSMRRAQAVANHLASLGLPDGAMDVIAHGEDLPVVDCPNASRAEQVRCLAPNRRVEVLIQIVPPA